MNRSRFRSALIHIGHSLTSFKCIATLNGLIGGTYLLVWLQPFVASFGTGLSASAAVLLTIAISVCLGWRSKPVVPQESMLDRIFGRFAMIHLGLAVCTILFFSLVDLLFFIAGSIPVHTFTNPFVEFGFHLGAAVFVLAVPIYLLTRLPFSLGTKQNPFVGHSPTITIRYLTGIAVGLLASVLITAPLIGLHWIAWFASLISCAVFLITMVRRTSTHTNSQAKPNADTAKSLPGFQSPPTSLLSIDTLSIVCIGVIVAGLFRFTQQLMPAASWLLFTEWSVLVLGLTCGYSITSRRLKTSSNLDMIRMAACMFLSTWSVCLLAAFPLFIHASLLLNAYISHVWLLVLLRGLLVTVALFPVGIVWGLLASLSSINVSTKSVPNLDGETDQQTSPKDGFAGLLQAQPLAIAIGYLLAKNLLVAGWNIPALLIIAAWALPLMAIISTVRHRSFTRHRPARFFLAGVACLILAAPLWRQNYRPEHAAKLLFNTGSFISYQAGIALPSLPYLDEGRCVAVREGENGTYSLWKYRGLQLQLRESGIPKGILSTNNRIFPEFSGETMRAVMPLVLHEQPQRVLLLGLGCSSTLATCLSFPVQNVICVEQDRAIVKLNRGVIAEQTSFDPLNDERVTLLQTTPQLSVAGRTASFDVIISQPDQSSLLQSTPSLTADFYQRAAEQLSEDGIFCQSFPFTDYGPEPIRIVVRTLQSVFREVIAVETAPGEMLLLATNSEHPLIHPDLISRFEVPHVRHVLSRVGWDWSVVLKLFTYNDESLATIADMDSPEINTAVNNRLAFLLPLEMMQWGDKGKQVRTVLAQHSRRLLDRLGNDADTSEVVRRMADVTTQRRLIADYPDQWWIYRKYVRQQLQEKPRSKIQQVSGGGGLKNLIHPEDRSRKRFFEALGDAANSPKPEEIEYLARFESPYDPLVSYFLHQELAHLYQKTDQRHLQAELAHRLHAVHFAVPTDRSVRNVIEILDLIVNQEEIIPDPRTRWDHINGLLQTLQVRWNTRGKVTPKSSRITLNDINKSIAAIEMSFEAMEQLTGEANLSVEEWETRREVLKKMLLRPLRSYRRQLLPHHVRNQKQAKALRKKTSVRHSSGL